MGVVAVRADEVFVIERLPFYDLTSDREPIVNSDGQCG